MFDPLIGALCRRIGWTLIHFVWQSLSVVLALAMVLAMLKRASARIRYAVNCLALMAMAILPVVTFCVPESTHQASHPLPEIPASAAVASSDQAPPVPAIEAIGRDAELPPSGSIHQAVIPRESRFGLMPEQSLPYMSLLWRICVMALCVWHMGGWKLSTGKDENGFLLHQIWIVCEFIREIRIAEWFCQRQPVKGSTVVFPNGECE